MDEVIKTGENKKLTTNSSKKTTQLMSSLEKQLIEQFGFSINKNDTGYFRIPFHDRAHMQMILDKWGMKDSIDIVEGDVTK